MKNIIILFLAAGVTALGALCVVQSHKLAVEQTQTASLRGELEQTAQHVTTLEEAQKHAEKQRRELLRQSDGLAAQLQARHAAEAKALGAGAPKSPPGAATEHGDKDQAGFGNMFSKMMKDPEAQKVIRQQQRAMVDQLYSPLVKQLGMAPDEAEKFKDLVADNMMKTALSSFSMFDASASTNRAEQISQIGNDQKAFDEQVREFLGESGYAQYKDYQASVGERMQLNQFQQQNAGSDHPITDQQAQQLLAIMQEEKKNVAASTGQPVYGSGNDQAKLQAMLSSEQSDQMIQSMETVNQRVYDRASAVLSPDQMASFGTFQTNQLQMMRMGMTMARKFLAPAKSDGAAAPQ
jgi:hypothetical protein